MVAEKRLPVKLRLLLSHPQILKAGQLVNADLKCLEAACRSTVTFVGGLDLAKYAKDRHIVPNAICSLADLSALVLGQCLNKNVAKRLSNQWGNDVLSQKQLMYAAGAAYAALCIYHCLSKLNISQPLPLYPRSLTEVLLYSPDNTTIIAHGHLSPNMHLAQYDNINLTVQEHL